MRTVVQSFQIKLKLKSINIFLFGGGIGWRKKASLEKEGKMCTAPFVGSYKENLKKKKRITHQLLIQLDGIKANYLYLYAIQWIKHKRSKQPLLEKSDPGMPSVKTWNDESFRAVCGGHMCTYCQISVLISLIYGI